MHALQLLLLLFTQSSSKGDNYLRNMQGAGIDYITNSDCSCYHCCHSDYSFAAAAAAPATAAAATTATATVPSELYANVRQLVHPALRRLLAAACTALNQQQVFKLLAQVALHSTFHFAIAVCCSLSIEVSTRDLW